MNSIVVELMSKMFTYNGKKLETWNPFTGCHFDCSYCWARKLAEGKLKDCYRDGFNCEYHPDRINKRFKSDEFVFVCSMGDISFAEDYVKNAIIDTIKKNQQTKFLFCTKNPGMYQKFPDMDNCYYGATIETNRTYPNTISKAPDVKLRMAIMVSLEGVKKFLSIEPIMDFDLIEFSNWIYDINPDIVEIGADNYNNNLPEPSSDKVLKLIDILTLHGVNVIQKQGLERLLSAIRCNKG